MPSSLNGTGVTFNDATTLQSGNIPAANLGSGTANSTTFLRGDKTWQAISIPADPIPSGTVMLFVQTAAPTGWTKSTTHDNKALRVVSGTAGSGGSAAFTTAFGTPSVSGSVSISVSGTVGNHTLTVAQMPSHAHNVGTNGCGASFSASTSSSGIVGPTTYATGGNGAHNHSWSGSGSGSLSSASASINVAYVDVIIATKN